MVGEDQELTRGSLILEAPPISTPSYLPYAAQALLEEILRLPGLEPGEGWSYRTRSFRGGSDHAVLSDPMVGGPVLMLGHWPDRFYHSDMDTPEAVSEEELTRVGLLAGALAVLMAYETADVGWLLESAAASWRREMSEASKRLDYQGLCHLWQLRREDILTVAYTAKDPYPVVSKVHQMARELAQEFRVLEPVTPKGGPVVRRKFKGPLYFEYIYERRPQRRLVYKRWFEEEPDLRAAMDTLVYLCSGRVNLREGIERLMAVYPDVSEDRLLEFLLELSELELVEILNGSN